MTRGRWVNKSPFKLSHKSKNLTVASHCVVDVHACINILLLQRVFPKEKNELPAFNQVGNGGRRYGSSRHLNGQTHSETAQFPLFPRWFLHLLWTAKNLRGYNSEDVRFQGFQLEIWISNEEEIKSPLDDSNFCGWIMTTRTNVQSDQIFYRAQFRREESRPLCEKRPQGWWLLIEGFFIREK